MSGTQQFIIALFIGFPAAVSAVGALIVSLVTLYRQRADRKIVEENHTETQAAITDIHSQMNSQQDKIIVAVTDAALQRGAEQERNREKGESLIGETGFDNRRNL